MQEEYGMIIAIYINYIMFVVMEMRVAYLTVSMTLLDHVVPCIMLL